MKQQKPDENLISTVMAYIGSHTSEKKKASSQRNGKEGGGRTPLCVHEFGGGVRGGNKCSKCGAYRCRIESAKRFHKKKRRLLELPNQ